MLAIRGAKVTALDLRKRNCRILGLRASRYGLRVPAVRAVGEALPFSSGVFDLVICKDVTEHCRNPDRLLEEIARVLKVGGRAYVTFINRFAWIDPHYKLPAVNLLPRSLAEVAIRLAGRAKPNIRDLQRLSDMHYYTLGGAEKAARRQGLEFRDLSLWRLRNPGTSRLRRMVRNRFFLGPDTFETVLTRQIP
jgi:SAM-dependent methyltransferase